VTLIPGANIGPYRVVEQIGRGGMATVYKAYQPSLARYVAIKVLPAFFAEQPGFGERFQQEAIAVAKLRHPNILQVFDYGTHEGVSYIVSEFVDGGTLAEQVGKPLPIEYVVKVLGPIAGALDYAHTRDVLHRDIKPSNILLARDGTPVLSDFGLAKMIGSQAQLTASGATVGTPEYMAPEQGQGMELGPAADQYSLGIVAYELLAGRLPFLADTTIGLLYAQVHEPPTAIAELRPDCPPETATALMRMLEKDPARRWPDIESAVAELGGAPLTREDPIRAQLAALGRAKADADVRRLATPVSPLPATRSPKPKTTRAAPAAPRRIPVVAWALPVVALAAATGWWVVTHSARDGRPVMPPIAAAPAPETTAAHATPTPLAAAKPPRPAGERFAHPAPLSQPGAPAPRESTTRQPEPSPPVVDPRAAIEAAAAPLVRALESRNLARLRQVYPNLTVQQAQDWGTFFMSARNPLVSLRVTTLEPTGDRADAGLEGSYGYDDIATGRGMQRPLAFRATFVRDGSGWRLTSLR